MSNTIHAAAAVLLFAVAPVTVAQDAAQQGAAVLERVVEAYAKAPGLDERMRIEVILPADPTDPEAERDRDQMSYRITHGKGRDARIDLVDYEVFSLDGNMLVVLGDNSKYLRTPVEDNLLESFRSAFGTDYFFPISLYARHAAEKDRWLHGLTLGFLKDPAITGFRSDAGDAGDMIELSLAGLQGTAKVHVNPQSHLVTRAIVSFVPEGAPPAFVVDIDVAFTSELKDSGEGLVTFVPGDREAVASLAELEDRPVAIAVGEDAPSFTLKTLEGEEVKLADLRGQIVIIDFWATWCGPCILGLPKLQEFADFVKEEKLPVKVFAVNVWESERDPEKRVDLVREFWQTRKFTMPTLIDPDNEVVGSYGVSGIPSMFVIDQHGKIANVHVGFDPEIANVLKDEVARLQRAAG